MGQQDRGRASRFRQSAVRSQDRFSSPAAGAPPGAARTELDRTRLGVEAPPAFGCGARKGIDGSGPAFRHAAGGLISPFAGFRFLGPPLVFLLTMIAGWACRGDGTSSARPVSTATPTAVAAGSTPATAAATGVPTPGRTTSVPSVPSGALPAGLTWCTVDFIVDGDTFDVTDCDDAGRIRLILLDAPESNALCFADEAVAALRELMPEGSRVGLERDVSDRDRYGRYLRYVWNERGLVDAELIREGWAWLAVFPPDVKYRRELAAAEEEARLAGRGVWGSCPEPVATPKGGCDPAYPTVCIPSPPPDLSCRELPYRRFKVLPPDPHHFDGDGDGIACEGPPG